MLTTTTPDPTATAFTPTQRRILTVLADGRPHTRQELHALLNDELGPLSNVKVHVSAIRRKLPPSQDIVCVKRGWLHFYQHVRKLRDEE